MAPKPVRVAMIGLDHWYTAIPLAKACAAHAEIELVGIADADVGRARQVASLTGIERISPTGEEFLNDPAVEVVATFAGSDQNPRTCVAAAESGKHIVSIKPLARDLDAATEVVRAVRTAGVGFLPAECRGRLAPLHQRLKTWADRGLFGAPLSATFQMWAGLPQRWPEATDTGWFADPERAPGGGWVDHSIYHIDLLHWLFGSQVSDVTGMTANLLHPDLAVEDYGHAIVRYANGMIATIEDTWTATSGASRNAFSIVGTEATVAFDSVTGKLAISGSLQPYDGWAQVTAGAGYPDTVDDIVALGRNGEIPGSVEEAWRNLAVCRAFYTAVAGGVPGVPDQLPKM